MFQIITIHKSKYFPTILRIENCDLRQLRRHSQSQSLSVSHSQTLSLLLSRSLRLSLSPISSLHFCFRLLGNQGLLCFYLMGYFSILTTKILKINPTQDKFSLEAQKKKKNTQKNLNKPCAVESYRIGRKSGFYLESLGGFRESNRRIES